MLPVLALAGAGQLADTVSAGVSSLSRLLSGKSKSADGADQDSAAANGSGTSNPTSFASMLAAQGVGGSASGTATAGGSAAIRIPVQPHVSAGGAALAGGHSHAGGHRAARL